MTDLLAGVKLFNDCYKELLKMNHKEIEDEFKKQIKELSEIAHKKQAEFQNAVAEVTKLIQTKYPELVAEYSISDGGIIFIDDSDMAEYYNFKQIVRDFGRR